VGVGAAFDFLAGTKIPGAGLDATERVGMELPADMTAPPMENDISISSRFFSCLLRLKLFSTGIAHAAAVWALEHGHFCGQIETPG